MVENLEFYLADQSMIENLGGMVVYELGRLGYTPEFDEDHLLKDNKLIKITVEVLDRED